jgi:ecotin
VSSFIFNRLRFTKFIISQKFLNSNSKKMFLKIKKSALLLTLLCVSFLSQAQTAVDLSMFPKAARGQKQMVIFLPKKGNESLFNIELIAGKNAMVDCNNYSLQGDISAKNVEGWGYTYYMFTTDGSMQGTRMGCPGSKQTKFISALSKMVAYNSNLPIVIYVPENYKVKYRIWSAGNETEAIANSDQSAPVTDEINVTGELKKIGMTTFQYGTHIIGKYAVRSKTVNLKIYEGKKVTITGKRVSGYPLEGGPELLEVTHVKYK